MHLLPWTIRLSLLLSVFALLVSGGALATSAFTRNPGLVGGATILFLLVAVAGPLLLGRQIKMLLDREGGLVNAPPPFEEMTLGKVEEAAPFPMVSEAPPAENDETLRRTQKAQAIDRLRDGITHDLNNRLMVISANIDAVARQMKDQPTLQRKLLSALVATDQAAKLIAKSAAFARQGEARIQYVDLTDRVSSIAALLSRSLLRDTVELRLALKEELWPVKADPDDIETALVTLSAHVRDALTQGGSITLEAQNVHVEKGSLSNLKLEGDFVQLVIRSAGNNGEALQAPHDVAAEPSFALRDLDLSPWLSLNQSLRFLQALGGASEVRQSGNETAIILYLPRATSAILLPPGMLNDEDAPAVSVQEHTEILVVDDEVEVALALQSMLEEFGYVTSIATDAAQAMKSLNGRKPGLVLTDVAMPGTMNGAMLAREVRQIFPDLPILLITGNPVVADEESEFPLLQKPIISRDLHVAIQRHLTPVEENKVIPLFPRAS